MAGISSTVGRRCFIMMSDSGFGIAVVAGTSSTVGRRCRIMVPDTGFGIAVMAGTSSTVGRRCRNTSDGGSRHDEQETKSESFKSIVTFLCSLLPSRYEFHDYWGIFSENPFTKNKNVSKLESVP